MATAIVDSGLVNDPVSGTAGSGVGSIAVAAASITSVTDAKVQSSDQVICFPSNAAAGLLLQTKTCWVDTVAAGSFNFNVSATGAGAPAGTETFSYFTCR